MSLTREHDDDFADRPTSETPVDDHAGEPSAWLIRAGSPEHYDHNIDQGLAGIHFGFTQDLNTFASREDLKADTALKPSALGQLWRLRNEVQAGDLVVMPPKSGQQQMALGVVTRGYWYREDAWGGYRHLVSVDWKRTGVSRSALGQDLRNSLAANMTICGISRNDAAWRLQQVLDTSRDPGQRDGAATDSPEPFDLPGLIEQFLAETGYPTEDHEKQMRLRADMAEKLAPERIDSLGREEFATIVNSRHGPARMAQYVTTTGRVAQWISELSTAEYERLLQNIRYLCWSDAPQWQRLDEVAHRSGTRRTKNLGYVQIFKILSIVNPTQLLPVDANRGPTGRRRCLQILGLPDPEGSTDGQLVFDANDRLREHLSPFFHDDTLGMSAFLQWLLRHAEGEDLSGGTAAHDLDVDLAGLAGKLLVEATFLEDIVSLLEDKGQVILYGPPGTGKTYLARELAKELAPDDSCRALVQFHPSTSYEDFFEGYRPAGTGDDGNVRYELTPGPLARMAEQASEAPDKQHVMIIDEINRTNLPRVLGELLFLLEYRDESVQTLYRPDEEFSLPENLWFIGTMNTADRSIALVDAALRRRFHFVPFFPDSGPMAGLLGRWLDHKGEPDWIGRLVDAVNDELKAILEGSHLLLGPSHFMKTYGSSMDEQRERLRRIWEYNIEPFIDDQFFGDPDRIARFRFDAVIARHGPRPLSDATANPEAATAATEAAETLSNADESRWRRRADDWPPANQDISESYRTEQKSVIGRYVDFCLARGRDPSTRDEALIDEFLSSLSIKDSSRYSYEGHLKRWFDHHHDPAGGER
ncbi:MAG: AAA domain-containing protein [Acidimicrobiaceae bacterium]|nr:AAA domain-containing protein [Acidimicrobiaceae bacterium]MYE96825.1 AAA domain-containing protein [Acidimicrobiaceae bacterium]MYH42780.1 AAA domain-containing protein [Acidimicrobiaceae bacterium]MYI54888.1 AAA domain-containing protein [Acidimicrobiaceae bacterium]MYK73849.1 AAA domain-containing protein [Acidimicrobiaceae bacterium]